MKERRTRSSKNSCSSRELSPRRSVLRGLRQKRGGGSCHYRLYPSCAACAARVKGVLKSAKAQTVAKNVAGRFRKACKQVVDRKGAAADN